MAGDRGVHTPSVVLVTGASRFLGGYLVARLAQRPDIERVIAVDSQSPTKDMLRRMGRAEFVRADIRSPLIGKVLRGARVDTVVYVSTLVKAPKSGSRTAMKDMNILGAMQLFAACQKSPDVRKVVVRSTAAIYGCSAKDPAKFSEEMSARRPPSGGYARDSIEIEGYARGLGRRRQEIALSLLRMAPLIGPNLQGSVSRYLQAPVVPTILGRDARMQLLHEEDALASLERATVAGPAGTFNVAGDGTVMLTQAIRRAGGVEVALPSAFLGTLGRLIPGTGIGGFTREELDYFNFGCGIDTTRMRTELGFDPRWTTMQALDDMLGGTPMRPVVSRDWLRSVEAGITRLAGAGEGAR